jgi:hypothetical protein
MIFNRLKIRTYVYDVFWLASLGITSTQIGDIYLYRFSFSNLFFQGLFAVLPPIWTNVVKDFVSFFCVPMRSFILFLALFTDIFVVVLDFFS